MSADFFVGLGLGNLWNYRKWERKVILHSSWHANRISYLVDTSESHFVENGYEQIAHNE